MTDTTAAATPTHARPIETLAGFLSAAAIAVALLGIVYKPTRLALPAVVIALACVIVGGRFHRLATWAVWIGATSWFLGMMFAVITKHSIW